MKLKNLIEKYYLIIILSIILIVYIYPVLHCDFIWDSKLQIRNNPIIRGEKPLLESFKSGYWKATGYITGDYYRPLVTFILGLEYRFFGEKQAPFHLTNLFIFIFSIFLLYIFIKSFLPQDKALFVVLLFSLHPINSDNVFWLVGLSDLLSFLFILGALTSLHLYIHKKNTKYIILFSIFLILGEFSKETFLIYALFGILSFFLEKRTEIKDFILPFFSYVFISGAYLYMRNEALKGTKNLIFVFPYKSIMNFIYNLIKVLGYYFKNIILPFNYKMFFSVTYLSEKHFIWGITFLTISLISLFLIFKLNFSTKFILVSFLLMGGIHLSLLISPIFPYSISTRYAYFLLLFFIILFVELGTKIKNRKIILILSLFLSLLYITQIFISGKYYRDEISFWKKISQDMPEDSFSLSMYGNALFENKEYNEAEYYFKKALKYKMKPVTAITISIRLSFLEERKGNLKEALSWIEKAISITRANTKAFIELTNRKNYLLKKINIKNNKVNNRKP